MEYIFVNDNDIKLIRLRNRELYSKLVNYKYIHVDNNMQIQITVTNEMKETLDRCAAQELLSTSSYCGKILLNYLVTIKNININKLTIKKGRKRMSREDVNMPKQS